MDSFGGEAKIYISHLHTMCYPVAGVAEKEGVGVGVGVGDEDLLGGDGDDDGRMWWW